jgi:hypothetical protein
LTGAPEMLGHGPTYDWRHLWVGPWPNNNAPVIQFKKK